MQAAENCKIIQEKILKDARTEAAGLINAAKAEAKAKLAAVREQLEQEKATRLESSYASLKHEAEQIEQMKRNEVKKTILEAKQNLVTEIFESAYKRLISMRASFMDNMVEALVKEHASLDDIITRTDKGVVISNSFYEIKFTIRELLTDLRDDIEHEVVKILFGEHK